MITRLVIALLILISSLASVLVLWDKRFYSIQVLIVVNDTIICGYCIVCVAVVATSVVDEFIVVIVYPIQLIIIMLLMMNSLLMMMLLLSVVLLFIDDDDIYPIQLMMLLLLFIDDNVVIDDIYPHPIDNVDDDDVVNEYIIHDGYIVVDNLII